MNTEVFVHLTHEFVIFAGSDVVTGQHLAKEFQVLVGCVFPAVLGQLIAAYVKWFEHHLFRPTFAEELRAGQEYDIIRSDAAFGGAGLLYFAYQLASLIAGYTGKSFEHDSGVDVVDNAADLFNIFALGLTVGLVFKPERDGSLAPMLVAEHLQSTRIPQIDRLLNIFDAIVAFTARGALGDLFQQSAPAAEMKRLLLEHRRHAAGHRSVAEHLLHLQLILAHQIYHGCKNNVVQKIDEVDIERVKHVSAQLHRKQLFHRLFGDVAQAGLLPRLIVVQHPEHLISVAQLFGHYSQHRELGLGRGSFVQSYPMLLDRSKLGRRLGSDDVAGAEKHVTDHVFGAL